jgi:hypothetical protein
MVSRLLQLGLPELDLRQVGLQQAGRLQAKLLTEGAPAPAETLPEPVRQVAYMALLGIALLGMLLIVMTLLGGHWVRRLGGFRRRGGVPPDVMLPRPRVVAPPCESDPSGESPPQAGE